MSAANLSMRELSLAVRADGTASSDQDTPSRTCMLVYRVQISRTLGLSTALMNSTISPHSCSSLTLTLSSYLSPPSISCKFVTGNQSPRILILPSLRTALLATRSIMSTGKSPRAASRPTTALTTSTVRSANRLGLSFCRSVIMSPSATCPSGKHASSLMKPSRFGPCTGSAGKKTRLSFPISPHKPQLQGQVCPTDGLGAMAAPQSSPSLSSTLLRETEKNCPVLRVDASP
mmetsp:Transcript_442/g.1514  ORF Transcript_442/g.1514 Transcript_442/m.1514 type:complete len:232 (-) Transcript_442:840-1535(-)